MGQADPLEKEMAICSSILAWKIQWTEEPGSLQFMGLQRVRHDSIPGVHCGSDHEVLISKFRLKLKKVGEITRSFRYGLNQIPYNYTVEMTNRFKGLDLIDRVPEELWMELHELYRRQ